MYTEERIGNVTYGGTVRNEEDDGDSVEVSSFSVVDADASEVLT